MKYKLAPYKNQSGRFPVKEFIDDEKLCPTKIVAKMKQQLKLLSEFGPEFIMGNKNCYPLESSDGLYELKISNYRLFFSFCRQYVLVLYHIYKKASSSNKKQDHQISIAEGRMKEYQNLEICK